VKFNGKNFAICKTKTRALLRQYDLIHVIRPNHERRTADDDDDDRDEQRE
jgi:hypothetical protein